MTLRLQIDSGGEKYFSFAVSKLRLLKDTMKKAGRKYGSQHFAASDSSRIWISSFRVGLGVWMDFIKITVNSGIYSESGALAVLSRTGLFTGLTNHTQGVVSFWLQGSPPLQFELFSRPVTGTGLSPISIQVASGNFAADFWNGIPAIDIFDPGALWKSNSQTALPTLNSDSWHNFIFSYDTSAEVYQLYIDDVQQTLTTTPFGAGTQEVGLTTSEYSTTSFDLRFFACVAEFYWSPGQYLDIDSAVNRRRFITATGRPVSYLADGSGPTGIVPIVYDKLLAKTPTVNLGSGGNFDAHAPFDACPTVP